MAIVRLCMLENLQSVLLFQTEALVFNSSILLVLVFKCRVVFFANFNPISFY